MTKWQRHWIWLRGARPLCPSGFELRQIDFNLFCHLKKRIGGLPIEYLPRKTATGLNAPSHAI